MTRGFAFFSIEPINEATDRDRRYVGPSVVEQTIGRKVRIQGKRKDWREGEAGSNGRGLERGLGKEKNWGRRKEEGREKGKSERESVRWKGEKGIKEERKK